MGVNRTVVADDDAENCRSCWSEALRSTLRGYLKKSGRKQGELARASNVTESMLSKVLKGKAQPNLGNFCKFQAAFLVAHGGITQARQVP